MLGIGAAAGVIRPLAAASSGEGVAPVARTGRRADLRDRHGDRHLGVTCRATSGGDTARARSWLPRCSPDSSSPATWPAA
ncbi:MAG: hypothetical protein MZV64_43225 [Ignavibacteriales bacterium]|nr:hypothetical protein [Ignavibacteriales bacterium]